MICLQFVALTVFFNLLNVINLSDILQLKVTPSCNNTLLCLNNSNDDCIANFYIKSGDYWNTAAQRCFVNFLYLRVYSAVRREIVETQSARRR